MPKMGLLADLISHNHIITKHKSGLIKMIGMFLKNYKKFKAKKIRIGGKGKMKKMAYC